MDAESFYFIRFNIITLFLIFLTQIILSLLEYESDEVRVSLLTYIGLLISPVLVPMITGSKTFLRKVYDVYFILFIIKIILIIVITLSKFCMMFF